LFAPRIFMPHAYDLLKKCDHCSSAKAQYSEAHTAARIKGKTVVSVAAALFLTGIASARKPVGAGATYPVKRVIHTPKMMPDRPSPIFTYPPSLPWYDKIWGAGGPGPAGAGTNTVKK
jgi:hypothetical protein